MAIVIVIEIQEDIQWIWFYFAIPDRNDSILSLRS